MGNLTVVDSSSGWPFMVACISLVAIIYVSPLAHRLFRERWGSYPSLYSMLESSTELRMTLGFMMVLASLAVFAGAAWVRHLAVQAGEFGDLVLFAEWARWYLMAPSALLFSVGSGMVLWDGLSRRGEHICIALIFLGAVCWVSGGYISELAIYWWWGK